MYMTGIKESEKGIDDNDIAIICKHPIRVQCVRRKHWQWQNKAVENKASDHTYSKLESVDGEHIYETLSGVKDSEYNMYDSITVLGDQRVYCTECGKQNTVRRISVCCNNTQEQSLEATKEIRTGDRLGNISIAERDSSSGIYETIQQIENPTTNLLSTSARQRTSCKGISSGCELILGDASRCTPPQIKPRHKPSLLSKREHCETLNSVDTSFPGSMIASTNQLSDSKFGKSGQNSITYHDDSEYAEIEISDMLCYEENLTSADQHLCKHCSLHDNQQRGILPRDCFCRKAFKRK